jgi:hypothetical protein
LALLVIPAQAAIKLDAPTGMIVIPAQAAIDRTAAQTVQDIQDRRNRMSTQDAETCSTVDPGLRRDDEVSIFCGATHLSDTRNCEHQLDYSLDGPDLLRDRHRPSLV